MRRTALILNFLVVLAASTAGAQSADTLKVEIQKLEQTECADLAEKGQGQAAIACEEWRETELTNKRAQLEKLSTGARPQDMGEVSGSGDATR